MLGSIVSPEVRLHILRASVGAISTSDVLLADASDALVVGLNVVPDTAARALAEQKGVAIHTYNVIYRVKEEIERALSGMLKPEERETIGGHAEVRKVFRISRVGNVAGCYVRDGTVLRSHRVRLVRDGTIVFTGRIASLRRGEGRHPGGPRRLRVRHPHRGLRRRQGRRRDRDVPDREDRANPRLDAERPAAPASPA